MDTCFIRLVMLPTVRKNGERIDSTMAMRPATKAIHVSGYSLSRFRNAVS